ncbi:Putative membrane protein, ribonuclease BN-like family (fragment) [Nostocoides japonicum T1-X7]|uniref:Putative membrane protein, ribonuclease BN-like family n=1 Tax=Nostocoides japonicum T1-X7 TaxID=1194083 RepID=A0A077M2Q2_9MICO
MSTGDPGSVESPAQLPKESLRATVRRAWSEFGNDHVTDLAAGLTYYAVLAVVPGLVVLVALLGLMGPDVTDEVLSRVRAMAPGSSAQTIATLIHQAQQNRKGAGVSAIAGLAVALWSASGYIAAFMRASNRVYDIGEGRPFWKTTPLRLGLTVLAVVVLVLSAVIVAASGPVARQLGEVLGLGGPAVTVWNIAKWPVLLVIVSLLLAVLFWASPNARQPGFRWVSPGGVIAVLLCLLASAAFSLYVVTFASYDKTYGSLAGLVIFLLWMWLMNIAILFGLEVNSELERTRVITEEGLPPDVEPFADPRDVRKMDPSDRRDVETARRARRDSSTGS